VGAISSKPEKREKVPAASIKPAKAACPGRDRISQERIARSREMKPLITNKIDSSVQIWFMDELYVMNLDFDCCVI
jgi:hypothetical protein